MARWAPVDVARRVRRHRPDAEVAEMMGRRIVEDPFAEVRGRGAETPAAGQGELVWASTLVGILPPDAPNRKAVAKLSLIVPELLQRSDWENAVERLEVVVLLSDGSMDIKQAISIADFATIVLASVGALIS